MGGAGVLSARSLAAAAAAVALAATAACTPVTDGRGGTPRSASSPGPARSSARSSGSASAPAGRSGCPTSYAAPDPHRPRVDLIFTVDSSLRTVHGIENVAFTPDKPITELVFRLTANTAPTVAEGNRIVVTTARADHGAGRYTFRPAGAAPSTQGGLLVIPFRRKVAAGTTVQARVEFTVTLGANSFDRFGTAGHFAYFGSAEPLLAWERGFGWHTENMIDFPAESATSEAMDVDLTVTAPPQYTVIMSGDPGRPLQYGATRTWHSTISTARDVSVAVGPFAVADTVVDAGGKQVRLRVGAPTPAIRDALVPQFRLALTKLAQRYGPYPFPSLSVARLPAQGGGIEYPSSILMLDGSRLVAVHETAHQWFYAMVGDSQALHPWLDEAFAQYSEQLVDGTPENPAALRSPGPVDASTESYGTAEQSYYFTTYDKGSAALEAARRAAGAPAWDAALRCYVAANAWRIANPADLAFALRKLPAAVAVLRKAGALR
ncbi:M1 family aminopeptidase [uncultured Jatrophihabitans sp.]|uniref:M1 family aminopeptidase n=1 Tax=uncultured Jatrophihabitans sp. TaxID=1610747 RepID=UPI0035CBC589